MDHNKEQSWGAQRQGKRVEQRSRHTKAAKPPAPTPPAPRPPPARSPSPAPRAKAGFVLFFFPPNSTLRRTELGARTPSRRSHFQRNLAPEGERASDLLSLAHPLLVSGQLSPLPPCPRARAPGDSPLHHWNGCINELAAGSPGDRGEAGGAGAPRTPSASSGAPARPVVEPQKGKMRATCPGSELR